MRIVSLLTLAVLAGCTSGLNRPSGMVITPEGNTAAWTEEEAQRDVSLRNLRRTPEASFHLLRVRTEEQTAHVHEQSDLVFMVIAGKLSLEFGYRTLPVAAGDVIEIPRGTAFRVKNLAATASVAYLVYTPGLSPEDRKPVRGERSQESSWKWNLWVQ
jgi:mannose-6-phosphate isomerase-like protein (cupin superfamily)